MKLTLALNLFDMGCEKRVNLEMITQVEVRMQKLLGVAVIAESC